VRGSSRVPERAEEVSYDVGTNAYKFLVKKTNIYAVLHLIASNLS
jgi:hypothetical protein